MTEQMGRGLQGAENISIVREATFRNTISKLLNIGDRPGTIHEREKGTTDVDGIVRCHLIDVQGSRGQRHLLTAKRALALAPAVDGARIGKKIPNAFGRPEFQAQ